MTRQSYRYAALNPKQKSREHLSDFGASGAAHNLPLSPGPVRDRAPGFELGLEMVWLG